jgi:nicotinate-nucleotide adenylyltransferase
VSGTGARIGVLGGTFDPIHLGHLAAASEVHAALALDLVLVVPAAEQPFKRGRSAASPEHRLAMCALAVAGDPRMDVSPVDVERGAPTHTVDTLTDLAALHPDAQWWFITGADALARLDDWHQAERLRSMARFVGVTRPGYSLPRRSEGVTLVEVPALQVSSTDVRSRVAVGQPIRYLVPAVVADYIEEHDLYRGGGGGDD